MDSRRKEIESHQAEIARLEQTLHAEFLAVGRLIAAADRAGARHQELLKYLDSIGSLRKSVDTYRADVARFREAAKRIEALLREAAGLEANARELAAERDARLPDLGAGCWTVYRTLADKEPYRTIFEEVAKYDIEAESLAAELKALDEEADRGLFGKIRAYGQKITRRSAIARAEKKKNEALAAAGKKLAATDFARHATGDLRLVFDFIAEKTRTADSLTADAKTKRAEIDELRRQLAKVGIDDEAGVDARVRDVERRVSDLQRELDVMLGWVGQLFFEKDLRTEFADGALAAKYEVLNGLRSTMARHQGAIGRLRAESELEELLKKDKSLRARKLQLEEELKVKQRQIAATDVEIAAADKRIAELRRVLAGEAPFTEPPPLPESPDFYKRD